MREGHAGMRVVASRSSCVVGPSGSRHCAGHIFQRNAVSLLAAAAQPHTQAYSWAGYELLAITAATRRATWLALRDSAQTARLWAPLFNISLWSDGFDYEIRAAWEGFAAGRAVHTIT